MPPVPPSSNSPLDRDLGFGSLAARQHYRLLNRDGSFNVLRLHDSMLDRVLGYHALLNLSWPRFFLLLGACYTGLNVVFALAYLTLGPEALEGHFRGPLFWRAFFFSIHTFATVGYGNIVPVSFLANMIVALQTLFGLLSLAVATGLVFARFSRPHARILYSRHAIIAPYAGQSSFQFRIVNGRRSQLFNVEAILIHSRFELHEGQRLRRFYTLDLERRFVSVFPANWTIVHPVALSSPLHGWSREQLIEAEAEFLVLLSAVEQSYSQIVYSRSSYSAEELEWGRRFVPMFSEDGPMAVLDLERLSQTMAAPLPSSSSRAA